MTLVRMNWSGTTRDLLEGAIHMIRQWQVDGADPPF